MAICRFSDDYLLLDITPVYNFFLEEYMLKAPGEYVKVYLYGLRLCYNRSADFTLERMANLLGLEEEAVLSAYSYWERVGLVYRLSDNPPQYEYVNLNKKLFSQDAAGPTQSLAYPMGNFNAAVNKLLKDRLLHGEDYGRMYMWMESYGFSEKAVLAVIDYLAKDNEKRGRKSPTVQAIEKRIKELAAGHIVSDSAVDNYLFTLSDDYKGAKALLSHISIRRDPTEDEVSLYKKWTRRGFNLDALKLLCSGMVSIREPNMGYLDKIVDSYSEIGLTDKDEIARYKADNINPLKEVLLALGGEIKLNRELILNYNGWIEAGFEQALIIWAAKQANTSARGSKYAYFLKTLERCKEAGIFTLERALEEAKRREDAKVTGNTAKKPAATQSRPSKEVAAHRYNQREYSDDELEKLALDLFAIEGLDHE